MLKNISKVLLLAAFAVVAASQNLWARCGCTEGQAEYVPAVNQEYAPEIVRREVKSYNCTAPAPVYRPVVKKTAPAVRTVRHSPSEVAYVPYVDDKNETVLRPLSRSEIDKRSSVVTVQENRHVYKPEPKTEFLMSSRSERKQIFEKVSEEEGCKDGSIFGNGDCCGKTGSIFGGSCGKTGSMFGGSCDKQGSMFGGCCNKQGSMFGGCCNKKGSIMGDTGCGKCAQKAAPCARKTCQCQEAKPCTKCSTPVRCRTCQQPAPRPCPCAQPAPKPCHVCPQPTPKPTCVKKYEMQEVVRNCDDFAPFSMEWVDFRINREGDGKTYSRNLGNYKFRIFGCRRSAKNTILNEGRIVEKDMNFNEIFKNAVSDCYKVVSTQRCIDENTVLPEYVLTAEVTDYFMNVCDEYNWGDARMKGSRNGSSEITVTWRLMDASKTNVLWKGESKGYAELEDGESNGEIVLIQRAFADAADNLRYLPGFEDQLATRVTPEEMEQQRKTLMEIQRASGICDIKIVEDSGSVSSGFGIADTWVEVKEVQTPKPEPITEVIVPAPEPQPIAAGAIYEADKLCIVERVDYEDATSEGGCKVKDSIVSVTNAKGDTGVGLLISEQFVLTSNKLVDRSNNQYTVKLADGKTIAARAFRANPRRDTALLALSENATYTPLALAMELPPVGKGKYFAMGQNVFDADKNYLDNSSQVSSYRYTEDGVAEITTGEFAQGVTVGGILVDEKCRVAGISHRGDSNLFLPIETTIRSLGVEICGKALPEAKPQPKVATFIDNPVAKAPEQMPKKARK